MKVVVIIPAAGLGTRMAPVPSGKSKKSPPSKQFAELGGAPILMHTLRKFAASAEVSEIYIALREKGVPSATREGVRGDEIVEIQVKVPMPRDERTKELLRELAKLNPEDPRAELWGKV